MTPSVSSDEVFFIGCPLVFWLFLYKQKRLEPREAFLCECFQKLKPK